MKIELKEITIKDLTEGYEDLEEKGVFSLNGKLDIRPPFQREFVYKEKQRDAVINTVKKDFPLNVMYWAVRGDGSYEIIDGQQRTISICQYVDGVFAFENLYFHNLQNDEKEQILNYKLTVYLCEGTDSEKLEWFKTINIAGEKLYDQELRNAVYSGSWVSDAKRYFSKNGCAVYNIAGDYLNGSAIRQDYLETTIKWLSGNDIEGFMAKNQNEPNANELWLYIQNVINWVQVVFPNYRKEMKGIAWGELYNEYKDKKYDSTKLEEEISKLMEDEDVTSKKGIYLFILTKDEKHLNIRAFSKNMRREAYEKQNGICVMCKDHFEIDEMDADHILPWSKNGKTNTENCQMLCIPCNRGN